MTRSDDASTTLPGEPRSVSAARRFVTGALEHLDAAAAVDDAQVLVSELATNAVIHAQTDFTVTVSRAGDVVRLTVRDGSTARPRVRRYGLDSTTGRGVRLLETLALRWGVEDHADGKTLWLELPVAGTGQGQQWDSAGALDADALLAQFDDLLEGTGLTDESMTSTGQAG